MFTRNPFADLAVFLPAAFMQVYVVLMVLTVAVGTLADMLHKNSAAFFLAQWRRSRSVATTRLTGAETLLLAARTLGKEVATSGEFCNRRRRVSHMLMFYGFVLYLIATVVMVFVYPTKRVPAPVVWPVLWNIGALMVLAGGYWFFFFLRVDVAKEERPPLRLVPADLFIVSLLLSVTSALVWEAVQASAGLVAAATVFVIYIALTTVLFAGVPWSKFAHMFYKPAAAFEKRVTEASGSSDLPRPGAVDHIVR